MASINLAGVLRNPDTTLASGGEVRLIHRSNTGEVIAGFRETLNVNNDGTYDFNIQYGNVFIQTRDVGVNQWTDHGTLTINQDTSATTLPELLNAAVPPTNAQLLEFQILLSDAEAAADRAEAAGERSIKVYPTLADIQADSELESGKVVTNFQAKLDYYISENQETGGVPIAAISPQLYANPQQTTPGTGETNTASNIGVGEGLFAQKVSSDLQFRTQVSQYGLESRLIGDTYYRGLNPFVADNVGSFVGSMETSRSSETTYVDESGVINLVSADVTAYGDKGLSCFEAISYLPCWSEEFSNSAWSKNRVSVSQSGNIYSKPVNIPLFKIVPNTDDSTHQISIPQNVTSGGPVTLSVIAKKNGLDFIRLNIYDGSNYNGIFNLDTGVVTETSQGAEYSISELFDGFFICSITLLSSASTSITAVISPSDGGSYFAGDGVSGIFASAATITETKYAPPYKKTTSITLIKSAEFSSIQSQGNVPKRNGDFSFVIDSKSGADGVEAYFIYSDNFRFYRAANNRIVARIIDPSGASTYVQTVPGVFDGELVRMTVKKEADTLSISINGNSLVSETIPEFDWLVSGNINFGSTTSSGHVNSGLRVKKWILNKSLTSQQITELGGPDNVIL